MLGQVTGDRRTREGMLEELRTTNYNTLELGVGREKNGMVKDKVSKTKEAL